MLPRRVTERGYGGLRIQSYINGLPKWVMVGKEFKITEVGYQNWLP